MKTVLFVHGTGVRAERLQLTEDQIRTGLAERIIDFKIEICAWGDKVGARLPSPSRSMPNAIKPRGVDPVTNVDAWDLALRSPAIDLDEALVDDIADVFTDTSPSMPTVRTKIARKISGYQVQALRGHPLAAYIDESVSLMLEHSALSAPATDATHLAALTAAFARAAIANAIVSAQIASEGAISVDGKRRDLATAEIISRVLSDEPSTRGFRSWAVKRALLAGPQQWLTNRRQHLTSALSPIPGDILLYQARGDRVRRCIAECRRALDGEVVILAHSLGAIATFEALITGELADVQVLITVGTQIAFLYELDSLATLPYGANLPNAFPTWTNIFDPNDLLGFACSDLFPKVTDLVSESKQPFPFAHSAYWDNDKVLDAVAQALR